MISATATEGLILDDAEWALMDALEQLGPVRLGIAQQADLVSRAVARSGFPEHRLSQALSTLEAKDVLLRVEEDVVSLGQSGRDLLAARDPSP